MERRVPSPASPPHFALHSYAIFSSDENRQSKYTAATPDATDSISTSAKSTREDTRTNRRGASDPKPSKPEKTPPATPPAASPASSSSSSPSSSSSRRACSRDRATPPPTPLFFSFPSPHPSGHRTSVSKICPKAGSTRSVSELSFTCRVDTATSSGTSPGASSKVSVAALVDASNARTRTRPGCIPSSDAISRAKYSCVFESLNSSGAISMSTSTATRRGSRTVAPARATARTDPTAFLNAFAPPPREEAAREDAAALPAAPRTALAGACTPLSARAASPVSASSSRSRSRP